MLYLAKLTLFGIVIACMVYAALFLFPRKLRLLKRVGFNKGNAELMALARSGDAEAALIVRHSYRLLWIAIPSVLVLVVLNGVFRA